MSNVASRTDPADGIGLGGGTVTCRTSRSRCSPRAARRRPSTPSTPGTEVRRGPLLAARHGCILGLALLRAAGWILVPAPPPTHPWPRPREAAWTSHEHFSARVGERRVALYGPQRTLARRISKNTSARWSAASPSPRERRSKVLYPRFDGAALGRAFAGPLSPTRAGQVATEGRGRLVGLLGPHLAVTFPLDRSPTVAELCRDQAANGVGLTSRRRSHTAARSHRPRSLQAARRSRVCAPAAP